MAKYWTEPLETRLRGMWTAGVPASEIAVRLGAASKSAIIGKARRLGLPARAEPGPHRMQTVSPTVAATDTRRTNQAMRMYARQVDIGPPPKTCQWPDGNPGTPTFRFCGCTDLVAGSSYCAEHHRRAYRDPDSPVYGEYKPERAA